MFDSMGPYPHAADFCLKELSKSLTDWAYTWYINIKVGVACNWAQYLKSQDVLAKLGYTR